jgi:starch phosphorylase
MRELPRSLLALRELAFDLRWSVGSAADAVWRSIDAPAWEATRNPRWLLQIASGRRLAELASDAGFGQALQRLVGTRRAYFEAPTWCARQHPELARQRIAYFSMEFAVGQALPNYAGGLGVLAGDFLKAASDLGIPLVGVGIFFQQGYFRQTLRADGQHECYPHNEPGQLPVRPLRSPDGAWLRVPLRIARRTVWLRAWLATVGRVALYLLDTNDPLNPPGDRAITARLYGGGSKTRLLQEIVLGVGGVRLLERLGIDVSVLHLNEGHSAFAVLERARAFARRETVGFREALWATRAGNVFTTHTSVGAAFDRFEPALVERTLLSRDGDFAELDVPACTLLALGREHDAEDAPFSMAHLALRGSGRINGVSRLHGAVSRRLFSQAFPLRAESEIPIGYVTNGVHLPSWTSGAADALWTAAAGADWWRADATAAASASGFGDQALWSLRYAQRRALIEHVCPPSPAWARAHPQARSIAGLRPEVLTLGFARRFTGYKRPLLLLQDPERLLALLASEERPVQLLIAGKAHPADSEGKQMLASWVEFARRPELAGRCVVLPDYDVALAARMVSGVDVWINTPQLQWEACGTSGMKILSNGGLNLSVPDGWWAEVNAADAGWTLGSDADGSDAEDAEALHAMLERDVIPAYYKRDEHALPRRWLARIRASMTQLTLRFGAERMLREYTEQVYAPAAAAYQRRTAHDARLARALARFEQQVTAGWPELGVGPLELAEGSDGQRSASVAVRLGQLPAELLLVELCAPPEGAPRRELMRPISDGSAGVRTFRCVVPPDWPAGVPFVRVTPVHPAAQLPLELPLAARSVP